MDDSAAVAKMNDRLRKTMSLGKLNIELSETVATSPSRPEIIKAVREYKSFDPDIDVNGDHSLGIVAVSGDAYVFRYLYGDDRYDYSKEVGKRTLSIQHLSEFRSLKLGQQVKVVAKKILVGAKG